MTGLEVKMKVQRRPYKKFGFLKFDSEEDALKVMLDWGSFILPNHICINPQYEKKQNDRKSLFFSLKQFTIIPPDTAKLIKEFLKNRNIKCSDVIIPIEPAYESTEYEIKGFRQNLEKLILSTPDVESVNDFDLEVKKPYPKAGTWMVTANFKSSVQGMITGSYLKKTSPSCVWLQTPSIIKHGKVQVDFDLTTSFSCSRRIFDVLKDSIEASVKEVSAIFNKDSEKLDLTIKPYQNGDNDRAVFYLKGTDLSVLARTKDALDNILRGIMIILLVDKSKFYFR